MGLAPEHVTLEPLRAAVHDHSEGVAVVADAQEGEEAYRALPEGLLPLLSERRMRVRRGVASWDAACGRAYLSPPH